MAQLEQHSHFQALIVANKVLWRCAFAAFCRNTIACTRVCKQRESPLLSLSNTQSLLLQQPELLRHMLVLEKTSKPPQQARQDDRQQQYTPAEEYRHTVVCKIVCKAADDK